MLKNLRLRTINLLVSGLIGLAGICLAIVLGYTIQNIRSIEDSWFTYQADRSEKARLESVLRASIGYGGMIHDFKNYVLRHEEFRMDLVQADIGAARAVIGQYLSLGLSEAEKVALEDISSVLSEYDNALLNTRKLIMENATSENIDDQVKVDDSIALRGLSTLRSEVARQSGAGKKPRQVKGRIAANLRAGMGYGGMIHEFKNLVLRKDRPRAEKVFRHIASIEKNLAAYRRLGLSTAEKIALEDIEKTIIRYKSNMELIQTMIAAEAPINEIDKAVKIDDSPALRGLQTLDKEVALQIDILSKNVGDDLSFLANVVPWINWAVLIVILFAILSSVWIFHVYVIRPISVTTTLMSLLVTDETGISIQGTEKRNEIGQMARALETFRQNIISRKAAEIEIMEMAMTDPLTGIDNRKRFDERLGEAIAMAKRLDNKVACLMIDLDKFKPINDTYGHAAGDEVLKTVADRLSQISRDTDFVARLGGDEFAMVATALEDGAMAELPAKRIVDQLSLPVYYDGHVLKIGGSVGISIFPDDAEDMETLAKKADAALYAAKDAGRNTFRFAGSKAKKSRKPKAGKKPQPT